MCGGVRAAARVVAPAPRDLAQPWCSTTAATGTTDPPSHRSSSSIRRPTRSCGAAWASPYSRSTACHGQRLRAAPERQHVITEGATGGLLEIARKHETVWEYVSPWLLPSRFGPDIGGVPRLRVAEDDPRLGGLALDPTPYVRSMPARRRRDLGEPDETCPRRRRRRSRDPVVLEVSDNLPAPFIGVREPSMGLNSECSTEAAISRCRRHPRRPDPLLRGAGRPRGSAGRAAARCRPCRR